MIPLAVQVLLSTDPADKMTNFKRYLNIELIFSKHDIYNANIHQWLYLFHLLCVHHGAKVNREAHLPITVESAYKQN